jgi:fructoselysine-6-P-deglycase FrlB-like protein
MTDIDSRPGLFSIRAEMSRQHGDALASLTQAVAVAATIADSIRRTGRLTLIGMGGSHYMNRVVEPLYRRMGIDAVALVASELLYAPLPDHPTTALLVSQSGRSVEILRLLEHAPGRQERFGLTLNADSPLARAVPSLVGAGGAEKAYAATRSLLITQALHAAVLQALGMDLSDMLAILKAPLMVPPPAELLREAIALLADCQTVAFSGRLELQGLAEAGSLCLTELGRVPALALEGGQFRHGPLEMLSPAIGVVLLRNAGETAALTARLAETCLETPMRPVVFDVSGEPPVPGALTFQFPRLTGLAAVAAILPAMQSLLVELAARRVADVGIPRRSAKVTDRE